MKPFEKVLHAHNKTYKLYMWDTAGQERYRSITSHFIVRATGCLIVFDASRPVSTWIWIRCITLFWLFSIVHNTVHTDPLKINRTLGFAYKITSFSQIDLPSRGHHICHSWSAM